MKNFLSHKILLIIIIPFYLLCQGTISHGQDLGISLKGQWSGRGLLYATPDGFNPSEDSVKINIYEQDDLKFKGKIERNYNSHTLIQDVHGYLDKNKRNICFFDQENQSMIIGQISSNSIMKLYCWENNGKIQITEYILSKAKSSMDKKDKKLDQVH